MAEKLSGTPTRILDKDWQPLRDLGFDDQACLEVAHVVGLFNYLTDGFGIQLHPALLEAAESGIPLRKRSRNDREKPGK